MSVNRTMYQLVGDDQALFDLLADDGGEITPEAIALLEEHLGNLSSKADGYAVIIRELEADAEKFSAESARLAKRASSREGAVRLLKDRLLVNMEAMGRDKLEGELFTIARQKNPASVEVLVDPAVLPDEFVRVIPESRVADKKALLHAAKLAMGELATLEDEVVLDESGSPVINDRGDVMYRAVRVPFARLAPESFHLRIR